MRLQGDDRPLRRLWRYTGQQPVATVKLLFFRIARNIERDPLTGMGMLYGLVLRMQTAHTHRGVGTREP